MSSEGGASQCPMCDLIHEYDIDISENVVLEIQGIFITCKECGTEWNALS